jgi:hypothetical protein
MGLSAGNLYTESRGDWDPKKHMSWKMKLSAAGNPLTVYPLKS